MVEKIERLDRELVHKGAIIDVYTDTVAIPNGHVAKWDFIGHKGAAAIVPVMPDGKILMVRQYRNALDRMTLEIPAGGFEFAGEDPQHCAVRELEEETGYQSTKVDHLIDIYTTVAFCNEKIYIYVANDLVKTQRHLDPDEEIDLEMYSIEELLEKIYQGEIMDSKTVSSLLAYHQKYCR